LFVLPKKMSCFRFHHKSCAVARFRAQVRYV